MSRLVLEARSLSVLSHKFALLALSVSTLPGTGPASARDVRRVLQELSTSWSGLRNAEQDLLQDCDAALSGIMRSAFTRDIEHVFECFRSMARTIGAALQDGRTPPPEDLAELVRFVTDELSDTFNIILSAAQLVAEMAGNDTEKLALTDDLTGLPNRRALHDLLHRIEAQGWPQDRVAIMHVDLDNFKLINDTLGHAAGDAALRHATAAMSSHVRKQDFMARMGGDEFVLVIFGDMHEQTLEDRAKGLIEDVSAPFIYHGKECNIGGSVGIACGNRDDGLPLVRHMNNADLALYSAKNAGKGTHRFFTSHLRAQHEELEDLQAQIRQGLETGQFEPYFQPQVEGQSGKLVGFEALARWRHPVRGLLTPFHFLDAARKGGLLDRLDRAIMAQTFAAMRTWLDRGLTVPRVSVNLTAARLLEVDLVEDMIFAADKAELDPGMIAFEILESSMVDMNARQMIENVRNLSEAGFHVELDDFGTGQATISNLRNFKVDRIKIDRSFVKDVHLYSELAKITSAIIGLAHSLRIDALAEGVETPEERLVVIALGCDHIQGFGVSRPMPGTEVPAWIMKTQKTRTLPARKPRGRAAG